MGEVLKSSTWIISLGKTVEDKNCVGYIEAQSVNYVDTYSVEYIEVSVVKC